MIVRRHLVKSWLAVGIGSALIGFSLLLLGNHVPVVTALGATGSVQLTASQESVEPRRATGITGSTRESNCKGHFATSEDLPRYDNGTVIDTDWATVGNNHELWQVDAGTWADQGYPFKGYRTIQDHLGFQQLPALHSLPHQLDHAYQ